jgi:FtsP/CotA-like multicopper oxidase with cupredoxin domain/plastocyanin
MTLIAEPVSRPDPDDVPPPVDAPDGGDRWGWIAVLAVGIAGLAAVWAVIAMGLAARANDDGDAATPAAAAGAAAVQVHLSEFALAPEAVQVPEGGQLLVHNMGTVAHNFVINGTDIRSTELAAGDSQTLDLSGLEAGSYDLLCTIPGHAGSGMTGTLEIGGTAASATPSASDGMASMTPEEMDAAMAVRTEAFPAATAGLGAQELEPSVLGDGTKQFDLTASVVDWEIEPGKTIEAWTYNGTVPGPTMHVQPGDNVRIVLTNELPESTALHLHGIRVPNAMDGVPDITQPPIKPGESFTYEFVAQGPAVGMYHSHHNAANQVPNGLAGALIIGDQPLPDGVTVAQEQIMMLNDSGTIGFALNGKSFPATTPIVATEGDWIELHYMNEGAMAHPMHLHGPAQLVIAKDGFPLTEPYLADTLVVAPGERYTVLVHADQLGIWAWHCHILTHAEREDGMFGMVTALVVQPAS